MMRKFTWATALMATACADDNSRQPSVAEAALDNYSEFAPGTKDEATDADFVHPATGLAVGISCTEGKCVQSVQSARSTIEPTRETEPNDTVAVDQRNRPEVGAQTKAEVLKSIASVAPDEDVLVKLWLWEPEWDIVPMVKNRRNDMVLQQLIAQREESLAPSQTDAINSVEQLGAKLVARNWLTNSIVVSAKPDLVPTITGLDSVYGASIVIDQAVPASEGEADGDDRRDILAPNGISETGGAGGASADNVRVAIIESNTLADHVTLNKLNPSHVGWQKGNGSTASRVVSNEYCGASACFTEVAPPPTVATHGTQVTSVGFGSIEANQDPSPGLGGFDTTAQRQRSGLGKKADIYYYRGGGSYLTSALEDAITSHIDVANMSFEVWPTVNGNIDCTSVCNQNYRLTERVELHRAAALGITLVAAAGNQGAACSSQSCSVTFPGDQYDVIATGGQTNTEPYIPNPRPPFEYADVHVSSPKGWMNKTLQGGYSAPHVPVVGLVAPQYVRGMYLAGSYGGSAYDVLTGMPVDIGTSFSSPQVASLAVGFRNWLEKTNSALKDYAWMTAINVLVMGDARCAILTACPGNQVNQQWGYGFPRYFIPDAAHIGAGGGWGVHLQHINNGEQVAWDVGGPGPEGLTVNGWKFALAVYVDPAAVSDVSGVTNLPDLYVRVVDTCNNDIAVRVADRQGTRYLMNIRQVTDIRNRCLQVRVSGWGVRSGGEWFWAVDYYFSNATNTHLYVYP